MVGAGENAVSGRVGVFARRFRRLACTNFRLGTEGRDARCVARRAGRRPTRDERCGGYRIIKAASNKQNAYTRSHNIAGEPESKISDTEDEKVADNEIGKSPELVHDRKRKALPGGLAKGL